MQDNAPTSTQTNRTPVDPGGAGVVRWERLLKVGSLGGVVAAVINVVILFIGRALGADMITPTTDGFSVQEITAVMVVFSSVASALVAGLLFGLVLKMRKREPVKFFVWLSVVFFIFSLHGPLTMPDQLLTKLTLMIMHVVSAIVIVKILMKKGQEI